MINGDNYIGGMGASARPSDVHRGLRIVQRGLGQLIDNAEAYQDALREAYWSLSNDERITPEGTRIGEALDKAIALIGVLKGASLLCPNTPNTRFGGDFAGL